MLDVVLCYTKNYVYYLFYVSCFIQYLTQIQLKCLNGKTWKTNTNQRTNFCVGKKRKAVQTISFFVFSRVFCLFWWNKLFQKNNFFFFPIFINFLPMIFIGKKICENIRDIRKLNFPCCYFSLGCVGSYVIYV